MPGQISATGNTENKVEINSNTVSTINGFI